MESVLRLLLFFVTLASIAGSQIQEPDRLLLEAAATIQSSGSDTLITDLLAKGANIEARDPNSGDTPLIRAARFGNFEVLKALLAHGADRNAKNKNSESALFTALLGFAGADRRSDMVKALLAKGADPQLQPDVNARNNAGVTVLIRAAQVADIATIKALLAAGADVNAKANDGSTAIRAASRSQRRDIVELLQISGAEVKHADPVRTDELVQLSRLTRRVDPAFPSNPGATSAEEPLRFDALIGRNGAVQRIVFTGGPPALEEAARRALIQWRFEPAFLDEEYVEVSTQLSVDLPTGDTGTERDRNAAAITRDVAQARALVNLRRDGLPILEKTVRSCRSAKPPNEACADADDWYGMALHIDNRPATLRKVEPFYLKALELRVRSPHNLASMALSLELEAMAAEGLGEAGRAKEMLDRARELRARNIKATMNGAPQSFSQMSQVPSPGAGTPGQNVSQGINPAAPVFRVGGGVSAPSVVTKFDPEYAEEARLLKHSGTVLLSIIVDTQGRARSIELVKSLGLGLDEKAVAAVERWVFKPGTRNGQPVPVRAAIEVNFRLL